MRSVRNYALGYGITSGIAVYVCIRLLQQMVPSGLARELLFALGVGLFLSVCAYTLCKLLLRRLVYVFRNEVGRGVGATPPPLHTDELLELRHVYDFAVTALTRHDRYGAIADQLRSSEDISRTFTVIAEHAARTMPVDGAALFLRDGDRLRPTLLWNLDCAPLLYEEYETLLWCVINENRPLLARDTMMRTDDVGVCAAALIGAPLVVGDRPVGVFVLAHRSDPSAFAEADLVLARFFAGQAAIACRQAQLGTQAATARNTLAAALQTSRDLSESANLEDALHRTLASAAALTGSSHGTVLLLDDDGERVIQRTTLHHDNIAPLEMVAGPMMRQGLAGWVARERRAALIHDTLEDERWLPGPGLGDIRSALAAPLLVQGRAVGVITLAHEIPHHYTSDQLHVLEALAAQAMMTTHYPRAAAANIETYKTPRVVAGTHDVVALVADLRGLARAAERVAPEILVGEVLDPYIQAITEVLQQRAAHVEQCSGERVLAFFGYPAPEHDDADRAILAAQAMRQAVARLRLGWRARLKLDLGIAIGIGHGRVTIVRLAVQGRGDTSFAGDAVNLAARLQGLARAGEILVAASTFDALGAGELKRLGESLPPLSTDDGGIQRIYRVCEPSTQLELPTRAHQEIGPYPAAFRTTSS
ncbi:MAG TPA: GAF domain-containing protein [Roseiflexaceae bacterium]|nr:GAF domain-containing protein [Roseiflexaceae bacterium]